MKVLITGGAGYIGSSVAWMLIDKGHHVTIIDNLISGKLSNIPKKNNIRKKTYPKNTKSKNIIKNLMKLLSLIFLK